MTAKKNFLVFSILCYGLLMGLFFLSGPASASISGTVTITGNVPMVTYNVSVTGIDLSNATVTWMTNDNANSTVEYGTTTSYGSLITEGTLAKDHSISLYNLSSGTVYHFQVISVNVDGNRAICNDSTFTTTAIVPVTVVTTAIATAGGGGGSGSGGGNRALVGGAPPQQAGPLEQLLAQTAQMMAGPPMSLLPANNPGIAAPAASESYPMGFMGLTYNADGQDTISIDIGAAQAAGGTVTIDSNRVEVYQHHSPGVLLTFWGNNFTINNRIITGPVSRAEFVTDPLNATLALGNVSGSVHAALPVLTQRANLDLTIPGSLSRDTLNQFQDVLSRNGLQLDSVAYTLNVQKFNLTTGPANVTFTIPSSWADEHGGKDAVRIIRISEEDGQQELISTLYEGVDAQGTMIFRGDSPNGTSLFGLVTAESNAAAQTAHPSINVFAGLFDISLHYFVVLISVIALLAVIAYFGWWKRRL
jgi:hypothetical protein